jgi:predicted RND superfamily exporter protein
MLETMRGSGVGVASTSIALGVGVLVFFFSAWIPVRDIALLLAPIVLVGLFLSLVWLPSALLMADGRPEAPAVDTEPRYVA